LTLVDLPEADTCCGSAGTYNLTQPELAGRLLERKVNFIEETGATVVATGNPGCLAWIQQGLAERGHAISVRHPIEILDAAYRQNAAAE
jgi:glycolate oxidase iron-sulfur subunit